MKSLTKPSRSVYDTSENVAAYDAEGLAFMSCHGAQLAFATAAVLSLTGVGIAPAVFIGVSAALHCAFFDAASRGWLG